MPCLQQSAAEVKRWNRAQDWPSSRTPRGAPDDLTAGDVALMYSYHHPPPPHYGYAPPPPTSGAYAAQAASGGHPPPPAYGYGSYPPSPDGHPAHPPRQEGHPPPPAYGYYPPPPPGYPGYPSHGYPPPPHGWHHPPPHYWPPPPAHGYPGYWPPPREASRSRSPRRDGKYTCRFFIGIDNDDKFKVAKRIIGANGSNMKEIVKKSGDVAKLRLRGKGSGFAERDTNEESPEPLQLCISCPNQHGYEIARTCVEDLLLNVYDEYEDYCEEHGLECEPPIIRMTERHLAGDGGSGGGGGSASNRPANNRGKRGKPKAKASAAPRVEDSDRGDPPDGAPSVEEIEQLISDRNACRKRGEYSKADEIRDDLKSRGVVLSDEKGAHGDGLTVTSWRYWHKTLNAEQKGKLLKRVEVEAEIEELKKAPLAVTYLPQGQEAERCNVTDPDPMDHMNAGASTGDSQRPLAKSKKVVSLEKLSYTPPKKLREIASLEDKKRFGESLDKLQESKIQKRQEIEAQLQAALEEPVQDQGAALPAATESRQLKNCFLLSLRAFECPARDGDQVPPGPGANASTRPATEGLYMCHCIDAIRGHAGKQQRRAKYFKTQNGQSWRKAGWVGEYCGAFAVQKPVTTSKTKDKAKFDLIHDFEFFLWSTWRDNFDAIKWKISDAVNVDRGSFHLETEGGEKLPFDADCIEMHEALSKRSQSCPMLEEKPLVRIKILVVRPWGGIVGSRAALLESGPILGPMSMLDWGMDLEKRVLGKLLEVPAWPPGLACIQTYSDVPRSFTACAGCGRDVAPGMERRGGWPDWRVLGLQLRTFVIFSALEDSFYLAPKREELDSETASGSSSDSPPPVSPPAVSSMIGERRAFAQRQEVRVRFREAGYVPQSHLEPCRSCLLLELARHKTAR
eukprot:s3948_g1.t1